MLILFAATASAAGFVARAQMTYGVGFPLDDAWIHQTYARNLAVRGEWAFLPGHPANGSTSPLWTLSLAPGSVLRVSPATWSHAVGAACLALLAWLCGTWVGRLKEARGAWPLAAACLVVFEWHLTWAAVSGMEVLLFSLLVVAFLRDLDALPARPIRAGVWLGLSVWVRPDGLLLVVALAWWTVQRWRAGGTAALRDAALSLGSALPFLAAFLLFNVSFQGSPWPNTFAAKQAEYAVERLEPLATRYAEQALAVLTGALVLLLPGIVRTAVGAIRQGGWARLTPLVWVAAHWGAYALRLPVVYQHGRYAMPTIPILIVAGMEGMARWMQPGLPTRARRILDTSWKGSLAAGALAFWVLGSAAYGRDVAVIETEMVATARWIAAETEPEALVAAHDIGALGFYGQREILDLAGLVSPEVAGFLRDEERLADYLDARGADYLMTFPGWYPRLVARAERVFTTSATVSPALGGENMAVYRW
jgi:hypothetical protein